MFVTESGTFRYSVRRRVDVLEFQWTLDEVGDRDAFIVLLLAEPIDVTPCDRLVASIEVAQQQTPRLEAKLDGGAIQDVGSRLLAPNADSPIDELVVPIDGRFRLAEVAVVIESQTHFGSGTFWISKVRLIRGQ